MRSFYFLALAVLFATPQGVSAESKTLFGRTITQVQELTAADVASLHALAARLRSRNFQMTRGEAPANSRSLPDNEWRSLARVKSDIVDVLEVFRVVCERDNSPLIREREVANLLYLFGVLLSIDGSIAPAGHFLDIYERNRRAFDAALASLEPRESRAEIHRYLQNHLVPDQDRR